jgi:hypothetical protein
MNLILSDKFEIDLGTFEIDLGMIEIDLGTIEYGCVTTSEELLYFPINLHISKICFFCIIYSNSIFMYVNICSQSVGVCRKLHESVENYMSLYTDV